MTQQEHASEAILELPSFSSSPLVEVALSVAFTPVARLRTIELVRVWDDLFGKEFPRGEEQPPYQMPIEQLGGRLQAAQMSVQFTTGLPTPRLVAHNPLDDQVIQLQNNYFARNWRKASPDAAYPRYRNLVRPFEDDLSKLEMYLQSNGFGKFHPVQCELTYINHIVVPSSVGPDLGEILTLVAPRPRVPEEMTEPESMRIAAQFPIMEGDATVGRIYVSADPARRRTDNVPITLLKVTARGKPLGEEATAGVLGFLDLAHRRAVVTFAAITRPEMHERWGKSDGA